MKFLWRYIAHDDPLTAAGNTIALVLGYNTPFYPAYLYLIAGAHALPWAFLTWCACPVFLAVPAVARRSALAGRIVLPLAGTANIVFCTAIFGETTGMEIMLIPCATLAALLFRVQERAIMIAVALCPLAAYFLLGGHYGAPLAAFTQAEARGIFNLNAASAGTLGFFMGFVFSRVFAPAPAQPIRSSIR